MSRIQVNQQKRPVFSKDIQSRIQQKLSRLLKLQASSFLSLKQFLQELITSSQQQDWIVMRELIQSKEVIDKQQLHKKTLDLLCSLTQHPQQTYLMRVYLYGLLRSQGMKAGNTRIQRQLKQFALQGKISMLISWLTETSNTVQTQETLKMLAKYYPVMVEKQYISVQIQQLQLFIHVICGLQLKSSQLFDDFNRLVGLVKTFRVGLGNAYSKQSQNACFNQEQTIIKLTLQVLSISKHASGNPGSLFMSNILKESDVVSYVSIYGQQILAFSQTQLVDIFNKLFRNSMQQNALILFYQLSKLLREEEKYYQLKILYQSILLPVIAYRGKAKINMSQKVSEVAQYFVIGFYQNCDIGINGLLCLLSNFNKIEEMDVKNKWIQLALMMAEKNKEAYTQIVYDQLEKMGINKEQVLKIDQTKGIDSSEYQIWQITPLNSRKLKTYPKTISRSYKGIQNNISECYIISVMQALFTTGELQPILEQYYSPQWTTLCYHIKELFNSLKSIGIRCNVDYIKRYGPVEFAESERQEDAQQYLSKVFEKIEEQLTVDRQKLLLQQLHKVFRTRINRKLQCQQCKHTIHTTEQQFIHTIPHQSPLIETLEQQIQDYNCENCSHKRFSSITTLIPISKILIVHINRFSFKNGKSQKELTTQPINRQFLTYQLKGILFHVGKVVECGHYLYYHKIASKKWIEMNDNIVNQFQLQDENERFENQMKTEMTPYLLFYVKKQIK